jgi:hypothetical protein
VSLSRLWLFLAVALPVLASLLATMSTVDLTYHLRAGAEIIGERAVPTEDTWTFTIAGEPWFDQQWGAQIVLQGAYTLGSWTGLAILRATTTAIIVGCLLVIARRRGLDARTAALLVLAAFVVAAPAMALRPQLLGMACLALVLLIVTDRRRRPGLLWLVPVITVVWANLHGSFFLGPLVLGLAWLEDVHDRVERPHRALVVAVVSAAMACLTPFGPLVWAYAAGLSANPEVTARISEWQPTSLRDTTGILFFASALAVVALIARRGSVVSWPLLAWVGVFFLVGVYAQRGVAWWPLAVVPVVAGLIPAPAERIRVEPTIARRLNAVVAAVLVVAAVALLPAWRPIDARTGTPAGLLSDAPPGITAALRDLVVPGDRIYNPQPWGSWFIYALPEATVAIDSRIETFPAETWDAYGGIASARDGWQDQLDAWAVTYVVLDEDQVGERGRFEGSGWRVLRGDADGLILGRQ